MKEIRLVCDLDGVVFDFNTHFINLARQMYPECTVPDTSPHFPDEWNYMLKHLPKRDEAQLWKHIIQSPDFWATCPTYDHAEELLVTAHAADKLHFLTSRSGRRVQHQTAKALAKAAPGLPITGGVIAVPQTEMKIPIINALRATHFVDDKPETIDKAFAECVHTKIAVWDQPWNREFYSKLSPVYQQQITRLTNVRELDEWLSSRD